MRIPERLRTLVSPLQRRLRAMPTDQMGTWVDVAGSEMSRALQSYVAGRDEADLAEFERGVATLVAMAEELRRRRTV